MKKILATILVVVANVMSGSAQSFKDYRIGSNTISICNNNDTSVSILLRRNYDLFHTIGVTDSEIRELRNNLIDVYTKSTEWLKIAIDNHIDEVDKEMPIEFSNVTLIWLEDTVVHTQDISPKVKFYYGGSLNYYHIDLVFCYNKQRIVTIEFKDIEVLLETISFLEEQNINKIVNDLREKKRVEDELFN